VCVLPYWLKLHYDNKRSKRQENEAGEESLTDLKRLSTLANDLNIRIKNLEAILDAETPDWRKKYE
jgi:phage shock protein B